MIDKKPSDRSAIKLKAARFVGDSCAVNALAIKDLNKNSFGGVDIDVNEIANELRLSWYGTDSIDHKELELMLIAQTHTLQNIFTRMTAIAMGNASNLEMLTGIFSVALKAQNQCRSTILAISEIKSPKRTIFIKQQNNQSLGHMQVNNDEKPKQADFSKISDKQANKLLEKQHGARLDIGTAQETIGADKKLATLAKINRGKDSRRKKQG